MIDVLATLCLLAAPSECVLRTVPVGAETCEAAMIAAAGRLEDWRSHYQVGDVHCGALAEPPLAFEEVRPGLFVHRAAVALASPENGGDIGNVAFVLGRDAVAVIDAGGSRALGEAAVAAIRARTDKPIRFLVLTHFHPDHVFGATAMADAGAEILAHPKLSDGLAVRAETYMERTEEQVGLAFAGSTLPRVDRIIGPSEVLDLGDRELELRAWPVGHSEADVTVLDRTSGTLIAGDLVFDEHLPTLDGSLSGWLGVLDLLGASEATSVVPGHGGPILPWPEGGESLRRYLGVLEQDLRALLADGVSLGDAVQVAAGQERALWSLFDEHNARNATVAYTELEWE
ncbi:quinoprotein relay system zinc metallohydrolase 2 [Rubellimicrobium rubrum]|uniref:Quinoprotein relay system zinc metallohydrolase 2 n=1 Tax=Rubellimicrobium rubrum TaxID=2585369 RepID=A0A5C4MM99_9RHOB|nr:quinoprotein relay system zinc metallohydrolase 2 [Rubellimicrobium rubrum]TNC44863.1 quinoprotein relay system zinc metallohydrolase 2 [Rubellimicrobium rubrum]